MATHSSILAWRIPWTEEPGGLQSTGLQRVGHDCSHLAHITYVRRPDPMDCVACQDPLSSINPRVCSNSYPLSL